MEAAHMFSLVVLGFVMGLKHALDADHVVAVSTIISETKSLKRSSLLGVLWGAGHTATLSLVGLVILGLKMTIPPQAALSFEFFVGILLMVLGGDVLRKVLRDRIHIHAHEHDSVFHAHAHAHKTSPSHRHVHRSFLVGMVHGLAGSAALTWLVLTTVQSVVPGVLYILIFGIGSTLGMLLVSTVIGLPFMVTARFGALNRFTRVLAGLISVALGLLIMYEIGYVEGLLL